MSEWHYTSGGAQLGPVSTGQLRELARAGRVTPGDLVWKEGMAEWVAASKLKGLFDGAVAAAAVGPGEYDVQPAYQPPPHRLPRWRRRRRCRRRRVRSGITIRRRG